ncbi:hypothetical protein OO015_13340 [Thermomicrobium sp. 4228-Ro]|uniref:hypothetical protein n=1 Tax=Thermomicrobium sp. 4228-Ro TaxID=2993937 RepID=UPI002249690E|nr:hypothetical protein [Thermomicrobium sp. 4228-Ro]MCX2728468.1 hypothetical protein [Thermomicrobium sp. 4228-Ro]
MRVCLGDVLRTIDGHDAGTIEWMLIDPSSLRVKSVVIRRGFILRHSLVVPLSELEVLEDGNTAGLVIRRTRAALDEFPEFQKELYTGELIQRLTGERTSPFYIPQWIPPASLEEPPPPSPEVVELGEIVRTIDQANAVLHRGAAVVTAEGERVAHLHDLCAALPSGELVSVHVRYGLPPHELEIPVEAVSSADDGVLYLRWWRTDFERGIHGQ